MGRRDLIVVWLLPLVLVVVAGHQVWLASTSSLTAWKGGGFGMFATVDPSSLRTVRGTFDTTEGSIPFDAHALDGHGAQVRKVFQNARALPDDRRMRPLAELVVRSRWRLIGGVARHDELLPASVDGPILETAPGGDADTITIIGGRLEVWRVRYDRHTQTAVPELVGSYELATELGGPGDG